VGKDLDFCWRFVLKSKSYLSVKTIKLPTDLKMDRRCDDAGENKAYMIKVVKGIGLHS
jgi:hypothetical protein